MESILLNSKSSISVTGETNLIKPTHIFPVFVPYEVSAAVSRSNFERRCKGRKTTCTKKTPKYVFRSQKDESAVL